MNTDMMGVYVKEFEEVQKMLQSLEGLSSDNDNKVREIRKKISRMKMRLVALTADQKYHDEMTHDSGWCLA